MSASEATLLAEPKAPSRVGHHARRMRRAVARVVRDPFASRSVWSLFDQAVYSAANFLTAAIIGHMCGRGDLGVYYLLLSLVVLARGVQEQITSMPYMVYCHRHRRRSLALYKGSVLAHQVGLGGLAVLALMATGGLAALGVSAMNLGPGVWVLAAMLPLMLLREGIRRIAFAHLDMATAVVIDLATSLLQIGGLLALAFAHCLTVPTAFLTLGAANGLAALGWLILRRRDVRFRPARIAADWRHNWSLARRAVGVLVVSLMTPYVAPWILAGWRGKDSAGVFAACLFLVGIAQAFLTGISNFLTPSAVKAFAHENVPGLRRVLAKSLLVFLATVGGLCLVLVVGNDRLLVAIYGAKYAGNGLVVIVAALSMLAHCFGTVATNGLLAMESPQANFPAEVAMFLTTLVVAVLTIGQFGVLGAALAMLIGAVVGAVVRCSILFRRMARASHELRGMTA